jgi:PQQ-like domain/WD domain, G-beta repeat
MRSTRTLTLQGDSVYDVTWSADGARLASCGRDGRVVLWRRDGQVERVFEFARPAVAVRFCGGHVVAATSSGTIAAWSLASGDERWRTEVASAETLAEAPTGEIMVGGADGRVSVHDPLSGRVLRQLATETGDAVVFLCCSPDGRMVAVSMRGAGVELLAWPSCRHLRTIEFAPRGRCVVYACVFAPDSETCAAGLHYRQSGAIGTTDDPDLYEIALWRPLEEEPDVNATLLGHVSWMRGLAFSPHGDMLVSGGFDENVCIWDPEFHTLRAEAREHEGAVYAVAFSLLDGASFATGSADRTVRLWDATAVDDADVPETRVPVGSYEQMLKRLQSIAGTVGRNPLLVVAQDVADGLLRLKSIRDMEEAVDRVVEAALSLNKVELGRAVTQTLTVRGEQARRTQDEATAFRCTRLNALFNDRMTAYFTRSIAEYKKEGGLTTTIEPAETSDIALEVHDLLDAVVAGSVSPEEARRAIAELRPRAGDLTLATAQLHQMWPDVLAGRRARAPVTAASAIVAELAEGSDDDLLALVANDMHGRLLAIGGGNVGAVAYLERAVEAARRIGDEEPVQAVLGNLKNVYRNVGRLRDSRRVYEEAIALAKKGSHFEGEVNHLARVVYSKAYGQSMTGQPATTAMHFRNGAVAFT